MPQAPSPNMGIIWPTDHDDANAWDVIMDTAIRVVIDGHNHAAGNGAKVAISQLAFDADISFVDAGGNKHAITNLKAIDFFPVATTDVTALAGAFFLNAADNELYFRSVTGVNIKFTNVGALNVGAFAGTIGGDYVGVSALEIFDDATDAYWFQQQIGTAVRQFAKMRCSDLSLFEFKAVGATPVPTQAVTLKSPAALAAGYVMTFPAALPAGATFLVVDSTGAISDATDPALAANSNIVLSGTGTYKHGVKTISRMCSPYVCVVTAASILGGAGSGGGVQSGAGAVLGASCTAYFPLPELPLHARIVNVTAWYSSAADRAGTTSTALFVTGSADPQGSAFTAVPGGTMVNAGTAKATASGVNVQPTGAQTYHVQVISNGASNPRIVSLSVDYDVP